MPWKLWCRHRNSITTTNKKFSRLTERGGFGIYRTRRVFGEQQWLTSVHCVRRKQKPKRKDASFDWKGDNEQKLFKPERVAGKGKGRISRRNCRSFPTENRLIDKSWLKWSTKFEKSRGGERMSDHVWVSLSKPESVDENRIWSNSLKGDQIRSKSKRQKILQKKFFFPEISPFSLPGVLENQDRVIDSSLNTGHRRWCLMHIHRVPKGVDRGCKD